MFKGMIIFWYGTVALIPHGWQMCDGTNGTPRLVSSHVVGAGGSYAVGAEAHVKLHKHNAHAPHYHTIPHVPPLAPGDDFADQTGTANPLISSDYIFHLPPYYAVLMIQKL